MLNYDLKEYIGFSRKFFLKCVETFLDSTEIVIDIPTPWISTESIDEQVLSFFYIMRTQYEYEFQDSFKKMQVN